MNHRILLTLVLLLAANAVPAQKFDLPPGKWWERPRIVQHLELSEKQQKAIRDTVTDHARRMIDLNAGVERTKFDLAQHLDRDTIDPGEARTAFKAFQEARRKLEFERFEMVLSVRRILSNEQWKKMGELHDRLKEMQRRQNRPGALPRPGNRPAVGSRQPGRSF